VSFETAGLRHRAFGIDKQPHATLDHMQDRIVHSAMLKARFAEQPQACARLHVVVAAASTMEE
jgi:hypothetical protein